MKRFHRIVLDKVGKGSISRTDLYNQFDSSVYNKDIGFNPWNFNLSINYLIDKGYIFLDFKEGLRVLILTEKGKHYYDVMLKVNK